MARDPVGLSRRHLRTLFDAGTAAGLTDGQLLERFAGGRGEAAELAFAALVERHGPMVLRACRGILRDEHEAMDAFQATFLTLIRKGGSLWVRDSLGPWLHRVACRAAGRARADAGRRRRLELRAADATAVDPGRDLLAAALHEEIDRLPARQREPVVLCDLEGHTYEEAARHLGVSVATVKGRLARGRGRLRARMARRGLTGFAAVPFPGPPASPVSLYEAATRVAAELATAGAVPAGVLTLTEGVLRSMFATKLKAAAAAALVLGFVATCAGVLAQQPPTPTPPDPDRPGVGGRPDDAPAAGRAAPSARTFMKAYYVGDLLVAPERLRGDGPRPSINMRPLIDLITSSVAPGTWTVEPTTRDDKGPSATPGSITPFFLSISLIIRHTPEVQDQVANFLRQLRTLQELRQPDPTPPTPNGIRDRAASEVPEAGGAAGGAEALKARAERVRRLLKDLDREIEALTREEAGQSPGR